MDDTICPHSLDPTQHFYVMLLGQRNQLQNQIKNLNKISQRIKKRYENFVNINITGSTINVAGSLAALVGLSLSPFTLGYSFLASVGLGLTAAAGTFTISSNIFTECSNTREVRRVKEIAITSHNLMREIMNCLDFLLRRQDPSDPILLPAEKKACNTLYSSVLCVSQKSFLVPEYTKKYTRESNIMLEAIVRELTKSLKACARPMDEICELLGSRNECPLKISQLMPWDLCIHTSV
ncbi:apolipoprotein L domain-containing protein 1 [Anolis sagrei]|uniref:apolipoprotein L domain-containing protein 1 n=1 Tax=Anolis sagrei TaxID=38937 RepID=UPI00295BE432|nr:apolipoprotein L domain-containing protein 1 [Anolis sagrei ordinatus]